MAEGAGIEPANGLHVSIEAHLAIGRTHYSVLDGAYPHLIVFKLLMVD